MKYLLLLLLFVSSAYANDTMTPSVSKKIIIIRKADKKEKPIEPKVIQPQRNYNGRYNKMYMPPQRAR